MSSSASCAGWRHDVDLQGFNTFGLPGRAARLAVVTGIGQLAQLMRAPEWSDGPRLILGGGSNVVLGGDFPGSVLKIELRGRDLAAEDADNRYVRAAAGENWNDFVGWTVACGWPGLENLALIPGTVGAAPIQNIGAYGLELAERFHCLRAVSLDDLSERTFDRDACRFGYRDSVFKSEAGARWLITEVVFRLPRRWQPQLCYADLAREFEGQERGGVQPAQVMEAVIAIRRRKLPDPACLGNAGSFFKNPVVDPATLARLLAEAPDLPHYRQPDGSVKLAAAWLIDRCGWKGRRLGPVGCHERQALVLVNHGGATGADVRRAAAAIEHDVQARFGVRLEPEPTFV
jgi:UDP-N-acetylmuramate dehydrogenase